MKYIQQLFRRLIIVVLAYPCLLTDITLFLITLGLANKNELFLCEKLKKLWK